MKEVEVTLKHFVQGHRSTMGGGTPVLENASGKMMYDEAEDKVATSVRPDNWTSKLSCVILISPVSNLSQFERLQENILGHILIVGESKPYSC